MNKRTIIGLISAGALFAGVGIARTAIFTERVVTDEALSLAQQTGQPVWETYQRNVWLAWLGSAIAVGGVSGVAAALYARDGEIDEIVMRASEFRDRAVTAVPALQTLTVGRSDRALPAAEAEPTGESATHPSLQGWNGGAGQFAAGAAPDADVSGNAPIVPPAPPAAAPIAPASAPPPRDLSVPPETASLPERDDNFARSPISLDRASELNDLFEAEASPPLNFTLETDSAAIETTASAPEDTIVRDNRGNEFVETFGGKFGLSGRSLSSDAATSSANPTGNGTIALPDDAPSPSEPSGFAPSLADLPVPSSNLSSEASASLTGLDDVVALPALCVAGDDRQPEIDRAKSELLQAIVDRHLDLGRECIVCDPLNQSDTWNHCKRFGQNEDYPSIDAAIAAIVAEIENRSIAARTEPMDFPPLTFVCFNPSLWVELCASSPLLAARAGEAANVGVFLLTIEDQIPSDWSAFGENELAFPRDLFAALSVERVDDTGATIARLHVPASGRNGGSSPAEIDLSTLAAAAAMRSPSSRSRPSLLAPESARPEPARPSARNLSKNLSQNLSQNYLVETDYPGYPKTGSEEKLRAQISLFQSLNMTREQIIVAVWDVRDPTSAEYELASTFYDRLTH